MASLDVLNEKNKKVSTKDVSDEILKEKPNKAVLFDVVHHHLSGLHHGTVKTKTRREVCLTTKKLYRQKGTGGARHGSKKSAPFVGGGRVFGPKPRDYSYKLNKKIKKKGITEALKYLIQENKIKVVDKIPFSEIKTKKAQEYFQGLNVKKALVVLDKPSDVIEKSIRNLVGFKTSYAAHLNAYDLLKSDQLVITEAAFDQVSSRYL